MIKVTKNGIETSGPPRELSEEDLEFINEMFEEFSNYQKSSFYKEDQEIHD